LNNTIYALGKNLNDVLVTHMNVPALFAGIVVDGADTPLTIIVIPDAGAIVVAVEFAVLSIINNDPAIAVVVVVVTVGAPILIVAVLLART
jgi:hypothetical protein